MASSDAVLRGVSHLTGAEFHVLVPNEKGYDAARAAGAKIVSVFAAASEGFSRANINCTVAESIERFKPVLARAKADGVKVRGYISCVLGCPFDGEIKPKAVADLATTLWELGCYEISLGDTIGVGTPEKAKEMLRAVSANIPPAKLAMHFHDTYGQALANLYAGLEEGVRVIDAAAGGLGGCPYAPGATGNVATEDVVYMLEGMGVRTGVDMDRAAGGDERDERRAGQAAGEPRGVRAEREEEARQLPSSPSLRAQRSNPESLRGKSLDCFVARAPRNDDGESLRGIRLPSARHPAGAAGS